MIALERTTKPRVTGGDKLRSSNRLAATVIAAALVVSTGQAEMLSDTHKLDSENIGVSGDWVRSTQYNLYSTLGLPPDTADQPSTVPSGFAILAPINATLTDMDSGFGDPIVIYLNRGWHLIGHGNDTPLESMAPFSDTTQVSTVWKWNRAEKRWSFYSPSLVGEALANYAGSKGYDVLSRIDGGEGFWVNVLNSVSLVLPAGTQVLSSDFRLGGKKSLLQGWNLVSTGETLTPGGFNGALSVTPPTVGTIPINVTTLWAWDNLQSQWYFYTPKLEAEGNLQNYISNKGYLDFKSSGKNLGPGVGFWVNMP